MEAISHEIISNDVMLDIGKHEPLSNPSTITYFSVPSHGKKNEDVTIEVPTNNENVCVIPLFSLTPIQSKDDPQLRETPLKGDKP